MLVWHPFDECFRNSKWGVGAKNQSPTEVTLQISRQLTYPIFEEKRKLIDSGKLPAFRGHVCSHGPGRNQNTQQGTSADITSHKLNGLK